MENNETQLTLNIRKDLQEAFIANSLDAINNILLEHHIFDISEAINDFEDINYAADIFEFIPTNYQADMFEHLNTTLKETILENWSQKKINELFKNIPSDEIVEILEDVNSDIVKRVLNSLSKEHVEELNVILKHDEESVGSVMTVDYIIVKDYWTKKECVENLKQHESIEDVEEFFVVDEFGMLVGHVTPKILLFAQDDQKISDILDDKVVFVKSTEDRENIIDLFKKYEVLNLPVVDENNKMVGLITNDDALDVMDEEATEDIYKMSGIVPSDKNYLNTSSFKAFRNRFLSLITLMLLGMISQILVIVLGQHLFTSEQNTESFSKFVLLTPTFTIAPIFIGTTISQTFTSLNRSISLNEIDKSNLKQIWRKELLIILMTLITFIVFASIDLGVLTLINIWLKTKYCWDTNELAKYWALTFSIATSILLIFQFVTVGLLSINLKLKKQESQIVVPLFVAFVQLILLLAQFLLFYFLFK